jgi:uncharacterized damage-inducible protein DinB
MRYDFLIDTYLHEHMVHQCVSEDNWFRTMLGIDVAAPPLPKKENRLEFIRRYQEDSGKRLAASRSQDDEWWESETPFFDVRRSRAWVMTRRMTHTAHHRGQQLALLRMLGREAYSTYGPTIYAYSNLQALLDGETAGGGKAKLPRPDARPVTERPGGHR